VTSRSGTFDVGKHAAVLGFLHLGGGLLNLVTGLFVLVLLFVVGSISGDPDALRVLTIIGLFVCCIFFVLGIPGAIAGVGLLRRRSWGRYLALAVGILSLFAFPVGTAIGFYTLWALLREEASDYFSAAPPDTLPQPEDFT